MLPDVLNRLVVKHSRRGILVDTNLLLLHIIGGQDPALVGSFKRTRGYTAEDYRQLKAFVDLFAAIITTPNVLTEVSNLCGERLRFRIGNVLRCHRTRWRRCRNR